MVSGIRIVPFKRMMTHLLLATSLRFGSLGRLKEIEPERVARLVFVCLGNVCRSPYAEASALSLGMPATSCGVNVTRTDPAEPFAIEVALARGKDLSIHSSRSIYELSLSPSDCLVVMAPSHLRAAQEVAAEKGCQITLIGLWGEPPIAEIPDPYGKSKAEFDDCFDKIDRSLAGLLDRLKSESV